MDEIKGVARATIRPGKLDEYKRLCEQAMEIVRTKDTGTLQYEIFFNEDESEAIVFERYRDIDAAMEHFAHIGHLMGPLWRPPRSRARCWVSPARRCSSVAAAQTSTRRGRCFRTCSWGQNSGADALIRQGTGSFRDLANVRRTVELGHP
ncbi:MAG: antibiotic biosynthesis monooxygenase [Devosia sp.]